MVLNVQIRTGKLRQSMAYGSRIVLGYNLYTIREVRACNSSRYKPEVQSVDTTLVFIDILSESTKFIQNLPNLQSFLGFLYYIGWYTETFLVLSLYHTHTA